MVLFHSAPIHFLLDTSCKRIEKGSRTMIRNWDGFLPKPDRTISVLSELSQKDSPRYTSRMKNLLATLDFDCHFRDNTGRMINLVAMLSSSPRDLYNSQRSRFRPIRRTVPLRWTSLASNVAS
jgi:hypothetical protein